METRRRNDAWTHYLNAWAPSGVLWCECSGTASPATPESVPGDCDLPRPAAMSAQDVRVVSRLIEAMPAHVHAAHRHSLRNFAAIHDLRRQAEARGLRSERIEALVADATSGFERDYRARVENGAIPILESLRRGDVSFLDHDDTSLVFCDFLSTQFLRTPARLNASVATLADVEGLDVEACRAVLRTIVATNVGGFFFASRRRLQLTFLRPDGAAEFLTGDQPIVDLSSTPSAAISSGAELHYPLAPTLAIRLRFDSSSAVVADDVLSVDAVRRCNAAVRRHAHERVFGSSEAALGER